MSTKLLKKTVFDFVRFWRWQRNPTISDPEGVIVPWRPFSYYRVMKAISQENRRGLAKGREIELIMRIVQGL